MKATKIIFFASLIAMMAVPFSGMQSAEATLVEPSLSVKLESITGATVDRIGAPVSDGLNTGLKVEWSGSVTHAASQVEYSQRQNICGQYFTMSGFYDTVYNKRGASYQIPSQINGICDIDRELSGYVELTLDRVEYRLTGDGNTTITGDAGSATSWYQFFYDGYSNSGTEYITITAYYKHTV
jgi:hypothetical protein